MTNERKELCKISRATFGLGGYDGAEFGLSLTFSGPSWGVCHFEGFWAIERAEYAMWSEQDRSEAFARACRSLLDLLKKAKKKHVAELVGVPVECTFDGQVLMSFRVLEEVL